LTTRLGISYPSRMPAARNLYVYEIYGADPPIEVNANQDRLKAYAKALLVVAGADGLSTAEMEHFVAWQLTSGQPKSLVEELQHFDYRTADVKQVITEFRDLVEQTPEAKRMLIYDALRLAFADGKYSATERKALQHVAEELGIDRTVVIALEGVVSVEAAARQMRLAIFKAT
jgi:uncharacterized tellurite resistance protein B-like protein